MDSGKSSKSSKGESESNALLSSQEGNEPIERFIRDSNQRIYFFMCSMMTMMVVSVLGICTSSYSNSDMVSVDAFTMVSDAVSFLINIIVEKVKQRTMQSKRGSVDGHKALLQLDVLGGVCSFLILIIIVTWGALAADERLRHPRAKDSQIKFRLYIFLYSSFNLAVDSVVFFWYRRLSVAVVSGDGGNTLNLFSGMLHMGVDAIRSLLTMSISAFMLLHPGLKVQNNMADAAGSFVLCIIIGMSVPVLMNQIWQSWNQYCTIRHEQEQAAGNPQSVDNEAPIDTLESGCVRNRAAGSTAVA